MHYRPTMCFCPAGMDACAYWRHWLPHLNIPNSKFMFSQGTPDLNIICEHDVVVVQRMMTQQNAMFLRTIRSLGVKIIFDLDDNLWKIPKFNPAYRQLMSPEIQAGLAACIEWADVITTSTEDLKKVVVENTIDHRNAATKKPIPVVVVDNCVDLKVFQPPKWIRDPDKVVIGWGGSNTHSGDLAHVWELLPSIIEKYPNVYLEIVGEEPPAALRGHKRVRVREWCHIAEFAARYATWNWDIVLAPLDAHRFNRSKSSIKMQEAGALGKPCLAQDIAPYRYFVSRKPELAWLLCDSIDWKFKIERLITDAPYREHLGALMYENVCEYFRIDRTKHEWEAVCQLAYEL